MFIHSSVRFQFQFCSIEQYDLLVFYLLQCKPGSSISLDKLLTLGNQNATRAILDNRVLKRHPFVELYLKISLYTNKIKATHI